MARKRSGAEKMALHERDLAQHGEPLGRLEKQLEEAHDASHLPEEPSSVPTLEQFVADLRLDAAGRAR